MRRMWLFLLTIPASAGTITLGSGSLTVNGAPGAYTNTGPSYISNPGAFAFKLTDGITTLSGQERRNNDPTGGPNTSLKTMTTFDGRQSGFSVTIRQLTLSDTNGLTQFFTIGLATKGQLQQAAVTANSAIDMGNEPGPDGLAGIRLQWVNDQPGGSIYLEAEDWTGETSKIELNLTSLNLAAGYSLTQTLDLSVRFSGNSMTVFVNGQLRGAVQVSEDLSNVVLVAEASSMDASNGVENITYSNLTAYTPSTVGAPSLIYVVSGDSQSGL